MKFQIYAISVIGRGVEKNANNRPAMVVSIDNNSIVSLVPITTKHLEKTYPLEVLLNKGIGGLHFDSKMQIPQIITIDTSLLTDDNYIGYIESPEKQKEINDKLRKAFLENTNTNSDYCKGDVWIADLDNGNEDLVLIISNDKNNKNNQIVVGVILEEIRRSIADTANPLILVGSDINLEPEKKFRFTFRLMRLDKVERLTKKVATLNNKKMIDVMTALSIYLGL